MWALTVFGDKVSSSAICAFVSPSATWRATSKLARCQGPPRLLGDTPATCDRGELLDPGP